MNLITFIKNTVLPITLATSIMITATSHFTYAKEIAAEEVIETEKDTESIEATDSFEESEAEETASDSLEDESDEVDDINELEETDSESDGSEESSTSEKSDERDELDDTEVEDEDSEIEEDLEEIDDTALEEISREITVTNTIDICKIQIQCQKTVELYDGFMPTGEYKEIPLKNSIEIEKGASLSSVSLDEETASIINAIEDFPDAINSSYFIKAHIDIDGKVNIISFTNKPVEHDSTNVAVRQILQKEKETSKED